MIYILSDKIGIGKSTFLFDLFYERKDACGVLQLRKENERFFVEIPNNFEYSMFAKKIEKNRIKLGHFIFSEEAFKRASEKICECVSGKFPIIIIDEFGILEKEKSGFYDVIKEILDSQILNNNQTKLITVIRENLLNEFLSLYKLKYEDVIIFTLQEAKKEFPKIFVNNLK